VKSPVHELHSSQVKSSQVKSSQVKSSQVKIQNGGRLSAAFGAHRWRERSGGQISAQPAPLDSPESGHHPHLLDLDHRGAPGLQHRAFSGSLQYGNATPLQADDGSDRGPARGLFRWAKVSVGSGDRRRRASSARGPSPTSFGRLGLTRARQPCSSGFSSMAGALGCLREALFNGLRTGRVGRSSARRDERRAAALLTICGFKRLRQQLVLYILKILKSSAGSSTARKPFQKASETRTARVSVSCSGLHADGARPCIRSCTGVRVPRVEVSMPSLCPCHSVLRARIPLVCMP
jgi:hypothetical protein